MQYTAKYQSPIGEILLAADEIGLTGLWFDGEKFYADGLDPEHEEKELPVFETVRKWLDIYFIGKEPDFMPPVHMTGSPFRLSVWELLRKIPYGETVTYGELAKMVAEKRGLSRMSAQAVGGAVGHNEISIIVPCHRVVGSDGSLTGYAGGVDRKERLLTLEGVDMEKLFVPTKGTAL
ncbi:MAG: methylated-DNA--[protein]-cysteine S-methyltransferase [Eubacterium sp.]|nr:methylated-DNA--[protein]-cysteine S-methyltransferase [Eubacterium sp.]